MNNTSEPSSPAEEVILPSAYSFGGFVQVRTGRSVRTPGIQSNPKGDSKETESAKTTDLLSTERSHAEAR